MAILKVDGLVKSYGDVQVVRGVSLAIEPGECFGLLGPNGAGKTTTLRLCLGLTPPDSGAIELAGFPVPARGRDARRQVGVVPQFDNLDPDFTVEENLLVYSRYFGVKTDTVRARIPELLTFAGLDGRADAPIQTLSGGMKRRLTLARALVNNPKMIVLDEPTTGLDPQARHLIWDRLRGLRSVGKTIVLTTHFMDEAERLCSRVAIMDHGSLITVGAPRALIAEHIEPHVIEVHGEGVKEWAAAQGSKLAARVELVGETAFCYATHAEPLVASLSANTELTYLHRPANLEDVFLRMTGRDLRD